MSGQPPRAAGRRTVVEALVALATRDGLGDSVEWADVMAAALAIVTDPVGPRDLRDVLLRVNDSGVMATLEDWFVRAAAEREGAGGAAGRAAEKLLAPLQTVSLGGAATSGLALAAGTVGLTLGAPLVVSGLVVAGATSYGRWRLSQREDAARAEAAAIRRLAEIARDARR